MGSCLMLDLSIFIRSGSYYVFISRDIYESYAPFLLLGDRNVNRLSDYHRMDIGISKKFVIDPLKFSIDLSILNVYDRKNVFYYKRDTGEIVNMLPFLPSVTLRIEL